MPRRIEYIQGDALNSKGTLFIEERPKLIQPSGQTKRRALFLCPRCKKNTFEAIIDNVKREEVVYCQDCANKLKSENNLDNLVGQKFGELTVLELSDKQYSSGTKLWHCKCSCGNDVYTSTSHLKDGHTKSCGHIKSWGEQIIASILREYQIAFEQEKTFEDCINPKTGKKLKFDFYILPRVTNSGQCLPACLIEFDGKQHYRPWFSQEDLKQIKNRDSIKNDYCQYHFIPLFRIPFYDINKLNWQYLERRLNSCVCF